MKTETFRTRDGKTVTIRTVLETEAGRPEAAFVINWARNQYGTRTAKRVVALILDGHQVSVASQGFTVDGEYRAWRASHLFPFSIFDTVQA